MNRALVEYVIESYREWDFGDGMIWYAAADTLRKLFLHFVKLFIGDHLSVRLPQETSPADYPVQVIRKMSAADSKTSDLKQLAADVQDAQLAPDRAWELSALLKLLGRRAGELFVVALSNVHLYDESGTRRVEWDGVFFEMEQESTAMYILEAKRKETRRSDKPKLALLESIEKAGVAQRGTVFSAVKCKGYAYVRLQLKEPTALSFRKE